MTELADLFSPELVAAIERHVDRRVAERLASSANGNGPETPWRTREQAAAHLHVSLPQLDLLRRRGKLDPDYVGRKPLYHVDELDALVRSWRGGDAPG